MRPEGIPNLCGLQNRNHLVFAKCSDLAAGAGCIQNFCTVCSNRSIAVNRGLRSGNIIRGDIAHAYPAFSCVAPVHTIAVNLLQNHHTVIRIVASGCRILRTRAGANVQPLRRHIADHTVGADVAFEIDIAQVNPAVRCPAPAVILFQNTHSVTAGVTAHSVEGGTRGRTDIQLIYGNISDLCVARQIGRLDMLQV